MNIKFKLQDEVYSKKLGVTAIGKIVGFLEGRIWYNITSDDPGCTSSFDRVYPEWKNKMVYYVEFPSEVKALSSDQFEAEQENGNPHYEGSYDDCLKGRIFLYPEDDLEQW